jgi:hypothetical protein
LAGLVLKRCIRLLAPRQNIEYWDEKQADPPVFTHSDNIFLAFLGKYL